MEPRSGLLAIPNDASVGLYWRSPSDTSNIDGWQYRYKSTGPYTSWTDVPNSDKDTTSALIGSLTNDTAYTFQLRAVDSSDNRVGSVLGDPSAPTATPSTTGGWTNISNSSANTTSHAVTGLTSSTAYVFQVRAISAAGNGLPSDITGGAYATPPPKPTEPSTITLNETFNPAANGHQAYFTVKAGWTKPTDTTIDTTIDGYQYRVATTSNDQGPIWTAWADIPNSSYSTFSYNLPLRFRSVVAELFVQIRAFNEAGYGTTSNTASVTLIPAKPAPTIAKTFVNNAFDISLAWSKLRRNNADDPSISLWQYRGVYGDFGVTNKTLTTELNKKSWTTIGNSGLNTTSLTISGAYKPRYAFQIRAVNIAGNSPASDIDFIDLFPDEPANFAVTLILPSTDNDNGPNTGGTATLHWDAADSNSANDKSIIRYEYIEDETAPIDNKNKWRKITNALTAEGKNASVVLSWDTPYNTSKIAKWQYRYKSGASDYPATWTDVSSSSATTKTATVSSLTNATEYTFQVRAVDSSDALVGSVLPDATATPTTAGSDAVTFYTINVKTGKTYNFALRAVNVAGPGVVNDTPTVTIVKSDGSTLTPSPGMLLTAPTRPAGFDLEAGPTRVSANLLWSKPEDSEGVTGWEYRHRQQTPVQVGSYDVSETAPTTDGKIHFVEGVAAGTYELSTATPTDDGKIHIGAERNDSFPVTITSIDAAGYTLMETYLKDGTEVRIGLWRASVSGDPTLTDGSGGKGTATFNAVHVSGTRHSATSSVALTLDLERYEVTITAVAPAYAEMKLHLKKDVDVNIGGWLVNLTSGAGYSDNTTNSAKGTVKFTVETVSGSPPSGKVAVTVPNSLVWTDWTDMSPVDTTGAKHKYLVSPLETDATYTFQIRAENATGTGPHSAMLNYFTRGVFISTGTPSPSRTAIPKLTSLNSPPCPRTRSL